MLHRLRIAVSVFFALVVVALALLWVRSYWYWDELLGTLPFQGTVGEYRLSATSISGELKLTVSNEPGSDGSDVWRLNSYVNEAPELKGILAATHGLELNGSGLEIDFPHWFAILLTVPLIAAPWCFTRRLRLRIVLSVFFVVMAAAFAVLWVWSHYQYHGLARTYPNSSFFLVEAADGEIAFRYFVGARSSNPAGFIFWSKSAAEGRAHPASSTVLGFQFQSGPQSLYIAVPDWFPMLLFGFAAAALTWKPTRRFSLRTLLFATTVIAVVLALAVWANRS